MVWSRLGATAIAVGSCSMISSRRRYFTKVRSAESLRATDDRAFPALFSSARCDRAEVMSRSSGPSSDIFLPVAPAIHARY